jgi:hypothetical protein
MIAGLATALLLDCIPISEADRFGNVRFDERVNMEDARLVRTNCLEAECMAQDQSGVHYEIVDGRILSKTVDGYGPVDLFQSLLPSRSPDGDVLTATVCGQAIWLTFEVTAKGPVYRLLAQP